jgi:hypothetical protein
LSTPSEEETTIVVEEDNSVVGTIGVEKEDEEAMPTLVEVAA